MKRVRPPLAAVLVLLFSTSARANPSLSTDFTGMSQWLSHEMAQGLAFNAGSNFDPPREVKGYYLQPDLSLGVGRMPFDKRNFPTITTPALNDYGAAGLFPSSVLFPNLSMHLRMGLPWRGDFYIRLADATTPSGYKISPTMSAKVQTNSIGFGIRQHFLGGDWPRLTMGAHFNHVQGTARLKGKFNINVDSSGQTIYSANDPFEGDIAWNINSFGLTAVLAQTYGVWTPFVGIGYNYATGSVRSSLHLISENVLATDVFGQASDRPEKSQGREIFGVSYDHPTWSLFANGELKALGQLQYRSYIVQFGGALPFDIGRGPAIFYKTRPRGADTAKIYDVEEEPAPRTPRPRREAATESKPSRTPPSSNQSLIYLK